MWCLVLACWPNRKHAHPASVQRFHSASSTHSRRVPISIRIEDPSGSRRCTEPLERVMDPVRSSRDGSRREETVRMRCRGREEERGNGVVVSQYRGTG